MNLELASILINQVKSNTSKPVFREVFSRLFAWPQFLQNLDTAIESVSEGQQEVQNIRSEIPNLIRELRSEPLSTHRPIDLPPVGEKKEIVLNPRHQTETALKTAQFGIRDEPQETEMEMEISNIVPDRMVNPYFHHKPTETIMIVEPEDYKPPIDLKHQEAAESVSTFAQQSPSTNEHIIWFKALTSSDKIYPVVMESGRIAKSKQVEDMLKRIEKEADYCHDLPAFYQSLYKQIVSDEWSTFAAMGWIARIDLAFEIAPVAGQILSNIKEFSRVNCSGNLLSCVCSFHQKQRTFCLDVINMLLNFSYSNRSPSLHDLYVTIEGSKALTKQLVMTHLFTILPLLLKNKDLNRMLTSDIVSTLNNSSFSTIQSKIGLILMMGAAREFATNPQYNTILCQVNWEKLVNQAATQLEYYRNSPDKDKFEKQVQSAVEKMAQISDMNGDRYARIYESYITLFKVPTFKSQDECLQFVLETMCKAKCTMTPGSTKIPELMITHFLVKIGDDRAQGLAALRNAHTKLRQTPAYLAVLESTKVIIDYIFADVLKTFEGIDIEKAEIRLQERIFPAEFWRGFEFLSEMHQHSYGSKVFSSVQLFIHALWKSAIDPNKDEASMRRRVKKIENYVDFFEKVPAAVKGNVIPFRDLRDPISRVCGTYESALAKIQQLREVLESWKQLEAFKLLLPKDKQLVQLERYINVESIASLAHIDTAMSKLVEPHVHATRVCKFWMSTQYKSIFANPDKLDPSVQKSGVNTMLESQTQAGLQPMSLKDLERMAHHVEESIQRALIDFKDSITDSGCTLIDGFSRDKSFGDILKELGLEEEFKLAKEAADSYQILKSLPKQLDGLRWICREALGQNEHSEDMQCLKNLEIMASRANRNSAIAVDSRKNSEGTKKLLVVLSKDRALGTNIGKIERLVAHFKEQGATHYQNLIFSPNLAVTGLTAGSITQVQYFVDYLQQLETRTDKPSLHVFLRGCSKVASAGKSSAFNLSDALQNLDELLELSNNLLKGIETGTQEIQKMMRRSTLIFEHRSDTNTYQVYARLPQNEQGDLDDPLDKEAGDQRAGTYIGFEKMKANKIQMAITIESQSGDRMLVEDDDDAGKAQQQMAKQYVKTVDAVESIKKNLESLVGMGAIFELDHHIKKTLAESKQSALDEDSHGDPTESNMMNATDFGGDDSEEFDENSTRLPNIKIEGFSVRVQIEVSVRDNKPQLSSLLKLAKVLERISIEIKRQSINKQKQHYIINRLKGGQKYLQCLYFRNLLDEEADEYKLAQSLMKYTYSTILAPPVTENPKAVEALTTTDEILDYFYQVIEKSSRMKQTLTEIGERAKRPISFVGTNSSNKFTEVLRAVVKCRGQTQSSVTEHPSQFFFANETTIPEEIMSFLICAAQDLSGLYYFMIDLHKLKASVSQELIQQIKEIFFGGAAASRNYNLLLFTQKKVDKSALYTELQKASNFFAPWETQQFDPLTDKSLQALKQVVHSKNTTVVESELPGLGKSEYILQRGRDSAQPLITVNISGDPSTAGLQQRLEIIEEILSTQEEFILHLKLDMWENLESNCESIDSFLFQLCYLRCVPFSKGYLFLDKCSHIYLELQNTCKKVLTERLSWVNMIQTIADRKVDLKKFSRIESLSSFFRVDKWTEDLEKARAVYSVFKNLDAFYKFDPDLYDRASDQLQEFATKNAAPGFETDFISTLQDVIQKHGKNLMGRTSLFQYLTFVRVMHDQFREALRVPGLGVFSQGDQEAEMSAMVTLRKEMFQGLIRSAVELTWGSAEQIRKQNEATAATLELLGATQNQAGDKLKQLLKEYKNEVQMIPDWSNSNLVSFFFGSGAVKIIYSNMSHVSASIRSIFTQISGQDLRDFSTLKNSSDELLIDLGNCLYERYQEAELKKLAKEFCDGKGFNVTSDNFNKILMVIQRAKQHIPIVMMGPTGCGKTYLVHFIAECLLQDDFFNITLHPGVTEDLLAEHLEQACDRADKLLEEEIAEAEEEGMTGPEDPDGIPPPDFVRLKEPRKVWVLFDEFNTSHLQCLVAEIMLTRKCTFHPRLHGREFPANLIFVAACNPFMIQPAKMSSVGLTNESQMRFLSHRVYPIPESLLAFVWKFGALKDSDEVEHIRSMVDKLKTQKYVARTQGVAGNANLFTQFKENLKKVATICQNHFKGDGRENSISLRDLNRFLELFTFFSQKLLPSEEVSSSSEQGFDLYDGMIVAIQLNYILRLESKSERQDLISKITRQTSGQLDLESRFDFVLDRFIEDIKALKINMETASLNRPLKENLLVTWTAILTKIPTFICGKPGTSKTLSISIINSAFNASDTLKRHLFFFKDIPKLQMHNFWGTETTTSESVEQALDKAKTAYESINSAAAALGAPGREMTMMMESTIASPHFRTDTFHSRGLSETSRQAAERQKIDLPVVLVFDEIGLAELSPDNPLKVLHPWLEPKVRTFSFIGLSNWKLDASKMNRVLYIARPDMEPAELVETCVVRFPNTKLNRELKPHFEAFAKAYVSFRNEEMIGNLEAHKNFHGSRDFYSTIGILARSLREQDLLAKGSEEIFEEIERLQKHTIYYRMMRNAIMRSFSGKSQQLSILCEYEDHFTSQKSKTKHTDSATVHMTTMDLIYQNLLDTDSRHLMIFTDSNGLEDFLVLKLREFQSKVNQLPYNKFVYLTQKQGREEMVRVTRTQLPVFTEDGYTLVMKDTQELYACMYDLLNKNYSNGEARDGKDRCKLFYDDTEKNVIVDKRFKIILLMDKINPLATDIDLEKKLPPPFLNRFEKYHLSISDFISEGDKNTLERLKETFPFAKPPTKFKIHPAGLVHNLSQELLLSLVVADSDIIESKLEPQEAEMKQILRYKFGWAIKKIILAESANTSPNKPKKGALQNTEQNSNKRGGSLENLISLFSRNMIVSKTLNPDHYNIGSHEMEEGEFQQKFLATHQFNSLTDLAKVASDSRRPAYRHCVVFTYSTFFEMAEQLKLKKSVEGLEFDLHEAEELHSKNSNDKGQHFQNLMADTKKILVVAFTQKNDWRLIQPMRFAVKSNPNSKNKTVIFTAHYSETDLKRMVQVESPVSFFSKEWRMVTIDDLRGCNYKEFFELLKQPVYSLLSNNFLGFSRERSAEQLISSLVKGSLRRLILRRLPDIDSITRGNRVVDLLTSRDKIIRHLGERLKSAVSSQKSYKYSRKITTDRESEATNGSKEPYHLGSTVEELVRFSDYRQTFETHNDLLEAIKAKATDLFAAALDEELESFEGTFSIPLLAKISVLPEEDQQGVLQVIETLATWQPSAAIAEPPYSRLIEVIKDLQPDIPRLRAMVVKVHSTLRREAAAIYSMRTNVQECKARFNAVFATLVNDSQLPSAFRKGPSLRAWTWDQPSHAVLAALLVFERYYQDKEIARMESLHQLLIQTSKLFLEQVIKPSARLTFEYLTISMICLFEIFEDELKLINLHLENLEMVNRSKPCHQIALEFIKSGVFEIPEDVEAYFKLKEFQSLDQLKVMVNNLEVAIKIKTRLPQTQSGSDPKVQKFANKEFLYSILHWMIDLEGGSDLQVARILFNGLVRDFYLSRNPTFTELAIEILSKVASPDCRVSDLQKHRIIDACLGTLHDLAKTGTREANYVSRILIHRLCSCKGSIQSIQAPIAILSKILEHWFEKATLGDALANLAEANIKGSSLEDELKAQLIFSINYQLVNTVSTAVNLNSTTVAAALRQTIDSGLTSIQEFISMPDESKILSSQQVTALKQCKLALTAWRENHEQLPADLRSRFQEIIRLARQQDPASPIGALGLLLIQAAYIAMGGIERMQEKDMTELATLCRVYTIEETGNFILPTYPRHEAAQAALNRVQMELPMPTTTLTHFDERVLAWNICRTASATAQTRNGILVALSPTPRYSEYIRAVATAVTAAPITPENDAKYTLVALGMNLIEGLHERFFYSKTRIAAGQFRGMINWEGGRDRQILKVLYLKQRTGGNIFTSFYQCTEPTCGYITLVANCGRLGSHPGEANTVAICSGSCGRQVGDFPRGDPRNNHLRPISEAEMNELKNRMVNSDTTAFRLEPLDANDDVRNLDENWVLCKYPDLSDRGAALFVYLIQHILHLVSRFHTNALPINIPFDPASMHLLGREINALQQFLVKDFQTIMIWLQLCMLHIQQDLAKPDTPTINDPQLFRQYLVRIYTTKVASFGADVEQYNTLRSRVLGEATENRLRVLNFINGNHSDARVREYFPRLRIASRLMRPKAAITINDVIEYLYDHKAESLDADFLWDLQNHSSIIRDAQGILGVLRDFSNQLSQKYNYHFRKSDCDIQFADTSTTARKKKGKKQSSSRGTTESMMNDSGAASEEGGLIKMTLAALLKGRVGVRRVADPSEIRRERAAPARRARPRKNGNYWDRAKLADAEESEAEETTAKTQYIAVDLDKMYRDRVQPMVKKLLQPLVRSMRDTFNDRMQLGCDRAERLLEYVINMDDPDISSLMNFVVPNLAGEETSPDHMTSFKAFIEAILSIQGDMIGKFRDLAQFMAPIGKTKKNFFNCHNDELMSLRDIRIEQGLLENAYYRLVPGTNDSELVVNVQTLASKWATTFFSQLEDLQVSHNFNFSEQRSMTLKDYCKFFETTKKLRLETNPQAVAYFEPYLDVNHKELENLLLISLEYLQNKEIKASNDLYSLIPQNIKEYASDKLLKSIKLGHIRLLTEMIEVRTYKQRCKDLEALEYWESFDEIRYKYKLPTELMFNKCSDNRRCKEGLERNIKLMKLLFLSLVHNDLLTTENEESEEDSDLFKVLQKSINEAITSHDEDLTSRPDFTDSLRELGIDIGKVKVHCLPKIIKKLEGELDNCPKPGEDEEMELD